MRSSADDTRGAGDVVMRQKSDICTELCLCYMNAEAHIQTFHDKPKIQCENYIFKFGEQMSIHIMVDTNSKSPYEYANRQTRFRMR